MAGKKVLIPRAEQAREILPEGLRELGARVVVAAAYQTLPDDSEKIPLLEKLKAGAVDCLTFTSSSTVLNFLGLFDRQEIMPRLTNVIIACIGPITAQTARDNGLKVDIIPESFTIPALVEAIRVFYQKP
jgi:uroporphyrinogen III methyltransferase/synthase